MFPKNVYPELTSSICVGMIFFLPLFPKRRLSPSWEDLLEAAARLLSMLIPLSGHNLVEDSYKNCYVQLHIRCSVSERWRKCKADLTWLGQYSQSLHSSSLKRFSNMSFFHFSESFPIGELLNQSKVLHPLQFVFFRAINYSYLWIVYEHICKLLCQDTQHHKIPQCISCMIQRVPV